MPGFQVIVASKSLTRSFVNTSLGLAYVKMSRTSSQHAYFASCKNPAVRYLAPSLLPCIHRALTKYSILITCTSAAAQRARCMCSYSREILLCTPGSAPLHPLAALMQWKPSHVGNASLLYLAFGSLIKAAISRIRPSKSAHNHRIAHRPTITYCPWTNGTVEPLNRDILAAMRALLAELKLGPHYWMSVIYVLPT